MKKTVCFLLLMLLTLSLFACEGFTITNESESPSTDIPVGSITSSDASEESAEAVELLGDKLSVVVLGDSIARGYGLKNVEAERFSSLLGEKLKPHYNEVKVSNFGIDGQTGSELAASLETDVPNELKECDVVIISIGGNNVLGSLTEVTGLVELLSNVPKDIFVNYLLYLFPPEGTEKSKFQYTVDAINGLFVSANGIFQSDAYKALVKKGSDNLREEIPDIIAHIKKVNPNARILFQTIYNPYKNLNLSLIGIEEKLMLGVYGEQAVSPMNKAINELSAENGYEVVPVWERFEESRRSLINAGFSLMTAKFNVDPHPNSQGHAYIADIYYEILTEEADA